MFDRILFTKNALATSVAILSIMSLSSCTKSGSNTTNVTPQGTVQLDNLKVGMPEETFKGATITFIVDPKATASSGGKTQYLSRTYDKKGGQYMAQCKGGKCFVLQSFYVTNPIAKEDALEVLKNLLPGDAPPQSKVDDSQMKSGKFKTPGELYEFADKYTGILTYTDAKGDKVTQVSAFDLGPDAVREGLNWSGLPPKGGKSAKPAKAVVEKSTSVKTTKPSATAESTSSTSSTTETGTSTATTTTP